MAKNKRSGTVHLRVPPLKPLALHKIKTYPLAQRHSKDKDYLAKLATVPLPKLLDLARASERRNKA